MTNCSRRKPGQVRNQTNRLTPGVHSASEYVQKDVQPFNIQLPYIGVDLELLAH